MAVQYHLNTAQTTWCQNEWNLCSMVYLNYSDSPNRMMPLAGSGLKVEGDHLKIWNCCSFVCCNASIPLSIWKCMYSEQINLRCTPQWCQHKKTFLRSRTCNLNPLTLTQFSSLHFFLDFFALYKYLSETNYQINGILLQV